jgi:DNA-binding NarL/FixJ family response regulator
VPIRVVIADDQAMVREGFSVLLGAQDGIEVVGEAGDGREATRRITAMDAAPKVVILTTFDLDEYVYAALRAGASGFLLKTASARVLADAVRVVAAGEAMLAPTVTRRLIAEFARLRPAPPPVRPDVLTARETEILTLVAGGLSNAEIAARLVIAEQTVKTHVGRILTKLGLRDRTQAAIYAYAAGLADPGI